MQVCDVLRAAIILLHDQSIVAYHHVLMRWTLLLYVIYFRCTSPSGSSAIRGTLAP